MATVDLPCFYIEFKVAACPRMQLGPILITTGIKCEEIS